MKRVMPQICFAAFVSVGVAFATEYAPNEIANIPWGSADDALSITEPHIEGEGTEEAFREPGMGPKTACVDRNENLIFSSADLNYLKGFDLDGQLLFDLMKEGIPICQRLSGSAVKSLIVDSSFIYIISASGLPIIPIIDYEGNIVDSLTPYGEETTIEIGYLALNYEGSLSIMGFIRGQFQSDIWVVTLRGNEYIPGGSLAFLASNGSYYSAGAPPPNTLRFIKYENPDTAGVTPTKETKYIEFPGDSLDSAGIINGGDGSKLYVHIRKFINDDFMFEVWEFDLQYNLLAKAIFPLAENKYDWFITPFVSRDGAIYEFRCLDDGLHVVKWTKE